MEEQDLKNIEEKKEECQNYHYSQSSKVSSLSRNIVYGIIATCWVFIYADNYYHKPCLLLIITMILCFLYLLLDIIHYFLDSCSYRNESFELSEGKNIELHEKFMDRVSKRSFYLLKAKFIAVLIIAVIFLLGTLYQLGILYIVI